MIITVPSGAQWLLIVLMILLLFGARRLPDVASAIGESIYRFKQAFRGDTPKDDPAAKDDVSGED